MASLLFPTFTAKQLQTSTLGNSPASRGPNTGNTQDQNDKERSANPQISS